MTTDLTVGKPSQKLFWFSIPLLLSVAFQQLYQMADSIIVGRFAETVEAGELALAAVGASYPITQLFVAVATGINIGTGVLVSQLFGAKRYLRMKTAISTALLTTTAVALLLTLIGAIGTHGIMNALSTPENIFADGSLYLRVYVFGLLFLFIYNVCTGIFNAMGDSPNAADPACAVLGRQCHSGYGICCRSALGRCRCCMGDVYCAGRVWCAGVCAAATPCALV